MSAGPHSRGGRQTAPRPRSGLTRRDLAAGLIAGAAMARPGLLISAARAAEPLTLRFAHAATPEMAIGKGFKKFTDLVEQRTSGQIKFQVYDNTSLAKSDEDAVKLVRNGNLQMAGASIGNMGLFTQDFYFFNLPYLFDSLSGIPKVWHSPIGEQVSADLEKTLGIKVLLWLPNGGWQVLWNNKRPVKLPDDLKGMKMRARPDPVEVSLLSAWGAEGTSITWPEVYTALSQGTVDGEILQYTWEAISKHYEAVKYATEVNATPGPTYLGVISSAVWSKLPAEQQKIMVDAALEAEKFAYESDAAQVQEAKSKITAAGVKVYTPTDAEMAQWRDKGRSVWDQFKDKVSPGLIKQVQDLQKGAA